MVKLTAPPPNTLLEAGAVGVVVLEFSEPEEAYEVEFCNERGETIEQLALLPGQFAVLHSH